MFNFDASTVAPQESFSPIPAGTYNATVVEAKMRPLNSGNGTALALTISVLDGPHANRRVFANLNVQHTNPEAMRIAQQQLSALCHATGALKLNEQTLHLLYNKPFKVKVKIRKSDTYGDQNDVAGFEKMAGGASIPSQPATPQAETSPAAAAPAAATPPWATAAA